MASIKKQPDQKQESNEPRLVQICVLIISDTMFRKVNLTQSGKYFCHSFCFRRVVTFKIEKHQNTRTILENMLSQFELSRYNTLKPLKLSIFCGRLKLS